MEGLTLLRDVRKNLQAGAAHLDLINEVFGLANHAHCHKDGWTGIGLFDTDLRCVAGLDVGCLPLMLDAKETNAAAIGSVAVHPDWRGRGLFNMLMVEALAWADTHAADCTFLYTETPALYRRYGFDALAQHAFAGAPPARSNSRACQRLDLRKADDRALVCDLLLRRAPLSTRCALLVDPATFIANVRKDDALVLVHAPSEDALIVYEDADDCLVIVDIVASRMPILATVLGILGREPRRVKCLFSPDRIDWQAEAIREDTGLMLRGALPPAMTAPFMFPPTCEF